MKNSAWYSRLLIPPTSAAAAARGRRAARAFAAALLFAAAGYAAGQAEMPAAAPAPESQAAVPPGYTAHYSVDVGGRITNSYGSGSMYDTLVNLQTGPRILGESFEMHALPGNKHTVVDDLSVFGTGLGGDPFSMTRLTASKGNVYEFSALFRRDRQYFDYNLLGNPNIPGGQSIPIGPSTAPTGAYAWPQLADSPFLFNTVRRMTDTHITLHPLSTWSYRFGYSQNIMQGPSLSPSGYQIASSHDLLLNEYRRDSSDDFFGALDWKPSPGTKLSYEEQIDHYKGNSYFTLDPILPVQEANGAQVTLLANYDSFSPYTSSNCNTAAFAGGPLLTAPVTGSLPVVNPACSVAISYLRTQSTRVIIPTEIFRLQSSATKHVDMNGDVRFTQANMHLPLYDDFFNGLITSNPSASNPSPIATRELNFLGTATAKRQVIAADYGVVWRATQRFMLAEQINFSNQHQPGTANMLSQTTVATAPGTSQTVNSTSLVSALAANNTGTFEGSPYINQPLPDFFGQMFLTNNLTGTWNASARSTLSLTYRYSTHTIAQGFPHNAPLPVAVSVANCSGSATGISCTGGTVTIHENGGVFNAGLHPAKNWDLNGTVEIAYFDNAFTPVAPRQLKRYRVHTIYKTGWITLNGNYTDLERHNNTNNNASAVALFNSTAGVSGDPYEGPLDHVDHSRIASVGGVVTKSEHYGFDFNYSYSDVYTATNICFDGVATTLTNGLVAPGAATPNGANCSNGSSHGAFFIDYGPARDFMDAPTQYGYAALMLMPNKTVKSDFGYNVSSVNGSRFFNDARDVNGSLVSTYQSPYADFSYAIHPGLTWKAQYNFYGYGEGGPSGAPYCNTSPTVPAPIVSCSAVPYTALSGPAYGYTARRNFHANNVIMSLHYEF